MSFREIFLPYKPRREDEAGHIVVQQNLDELLKLLNALRSTMYVGMCVPYPGDNSNFTGSGLVFGDEAELWAYCNGHNNLLKTEYADLYAHLGSPYSVDSTHFKLPDYTNGRSPIGKGANFTTVAAQGGERLHTQTVAELAAHAHTGGRLANVGGQPFDTSTGSGWTIQSTDSTGSSTPFNVMDPYEVVSGWVILTRDPFI